MLSFGNLSRAIYIAHTEEGDANELVNASITAGLDAMMLDNPPNDVVDWLRDWHNSFHGGMEVTYLQTLQDFSSMDADWRVHAIEEGITTRGSRRPHI
jgi:hypothetical protein